MSYELQLANGYQEGVDDYALEIAERDSLSLGERLRGRFGRVAAALGVIIAGTGILAPAEANADEPTCYGDYCSGQYADATNCDEDAVTIREEAIVLNNTSIEVGPITIGGESEEVGLLELRYSERCGTVWSRLNTKVDTPIQFLGVEQDTGYRQRRNVAGASYPAPALQAFSPMIYGRDNSYRGYVYSHHPLGLPEEKGTLWTQP